MNLISSDLNAVTGFSVGLVLGFSMAFFAKQTRGEVSGSDSALPETTSDQSTPTAPSRAASDKAKPIHLLADASGAGNNRVILNVREFFDWHMRRAHITKQRMQCITSELMYCEEFHRILVDVYLIELSPEHESAWLDRIDLPHFMVLTVDQLANLDRVTRIRFDKLWHR